jgi:ACS family glucarate transporter-like MFS transporter
MKKTNYRWVVGSLGMFMAFVSYMDRVNLSVATPMIMREFGFSKMEMGVMQTAFFIAYASCQIPGGMLAEYFGPRMVTSLALGWWSFFTALTGFCNSFAMFIAARFTFGLGEGPIFPSLNTANQKWFPTTERSKAAAMMSGGAYVGPIFGPAIVVAIMVAWGWRAVFYIFGVAGLLLAVCYYYFVTDRPKENRFVNRAEVEYIMEGAVAPNEKKEVAPWRAFIASSQFWAIAGQFFVTDYITYVFLAWLPVYLMEAHGFSLQQMGFAASLPWIAITTGVLGTGYLSDRMLKAGMTKNKVRTLFGISGLILCCVALNAAAFTSDKWITIMWLTLANGGLGPVFATSWASTIDLGGKFTGTVSGWMNFWGNIGGVAAPVTAAWIATHYGWGVVLTSTSALAVVGAILWLKVKPDQQLRAPQKANSEILV